MTGSLRAESDWLQVDPPSSGSALSPDGVRQADAQAHYITSLFEEENAGPDKALASRRQVLALDPGFTDLALDVSSEYLRAGNVEAAADVLKKTITAAPKIVAPYLALSAIYLRNLQKPDLAIHYARAAREIAPQKFDPYETLWEIYRSQGQNDKAAQVMESASNSKSSDAEFWVSLAEMYGRNALRDKVPFTPSLIKRIDHCLEKAGAFVGNQPELQSRMGDLYVISRQVDRAIPLYLKVVDEKPGLPEIRERLTACYIETGQTAAAINQVKGEVQADPLNLSAYEQLTQLYLKQGDFAEALVNAKQALLIEPANIDRHLLVVQLLYQQEKFDEMAETLSDAQRQFPGVPQLSHLYGVALTHAGKHQEAMDAFALSQSEALVSRPELLDGEFYFDYGVAAEQAGHFDQATELLKKSIALSPDSAAQACNYLGYMWAEKGQNLDEASRLIQQALAADPTNGAYLDSFGWLLFKQGKYDEALVKLLKAAEQLPDPDPVVYGHIADVYHQLGKIAEAVLYWQKALQLDHNNPEIAAKLDKATQKVVQQPAPEPNPGK